MTKRVLVPSGRWARFEGSGPTRRLVKYIGGQEIELNEAEERSLIAILEPVGVAASFVPGGPPPVVVEDGFHSVDEEPRISELNYREALARVAILDRSALMVELDEERGDRNRLTVIRAGARRLSEMSDDGGGDGS